MSVNKLIQEQTKLFTGLDKRFSEKITSRNYESRIKGVTGGQEQRIEARIGKLESQKAAAIARFDAAIKAEKTALEEVRSRRLPVKPKPDDPGGDAPSPSPRGAAKASAAKTAAKSRSGGARKRG